MIDLGKYLYAALSLMDRIRKLLKAIHDLILRYGELTLAGPALHRYIHMLRDDKSNERICSPILIIPAEVFCHPAFVRLFRSHGRQHYPGSKMYQAFVKAVFYVQCENLLLYMTLYRQHQFPRRIKYLNAAHITR